MNEPAQKIHRLVRPDELQRRSQDQKRRALKRVTASATLISRAWNAALETGGILVGGEVSITLGVELVKADCETGWRVLTGTDSLVGEGYRTNTIGLTLLGK